MITSRIDATHCKRDKPRFRVFYWARPGERRKVPEVSTMTQPAPGMRVKKTTYTEVIPPEDRSPSDAKPSPFYDDAWETVVNKLTKDEWLGHKMRVYRAGEKWERGSSPVDNVFTGPFTEEDLRTRFGGGKYVLWLYGPPKQQNLVAKYQVELDGQPILNGIPRNPAQGDGGNTVALEAMRMYANPEFVRMQMQMMVTAATEAMALIRSQMPTAQNPLETLRAAKEILGTGQSQDGGLIAHITLLKELGLLGSPEKKGISEVLETLNAFKTAGLIPSAVQKTDLSSTLAANLPMLVDRFVTGIQEFRLRAESEERTVRLSRGEMRSSDPNVITLDNQNPPAAQPAPQPAAPPRKEITAEEAQFIIAQSHLQRLVAGIKQPNSTGQDMYDYLVNAWPEILDELAKMSKETLIAFFKSREAQMQYFQSTVLTEVADDPRLPKMIEDFLRIAKESASQEQPVAPAAVV